MAGRAVAVRPLALLLLLAHLLLLQAALLGTGGLTTSRRPRGDRHHRRHARRLRPAGRPQRARRTVTRVRTAIRDRARRAAFLPQRDPDGPGRRRPEHPGLCGPATAA